MENNTLLRICFIFLVLGNPTFDLVKCTDNPKSNHISSEKIDHASSDASLASNIMESIMTNRYQQVISSGDDPTSFQITKENANNLIQSKIKELKDQGTDTGGLEKVKNYIEHLTMTDFNSKIEIGLQFEMDYHTIAAVYSKGANQLTISGNVKFQSEPLKSVDFWKNMADPRQKRLFKHDVYTLGEEDVEHVKSGIEKSSKWVFEDNVKVIMLIQNPELQKSQYIQGKYDELKKLNTESDLKIKIFESNKNSINKEKKAAKDKTQRDESIQKSRDFSNARDTAIKDYDFKRNVILKDIKTRQEKGMEIFAHEYHAEKQAIDHQERIKNNLPDGTTNGNRKSFISVSKVPCEYCLEAISKRKSLEQLNHVGEKGKPAPNNYLHTERVLDAIQVFPKQTSSKNNIQIDSESYNVGKDGNVEFIETFIDKPNQDVDSDSDAEDKKQYVKNCGSSRRRKGSPRSSGCVFYTDSDNIRKNDDIEGVDKINGNQVNDIDSKNYAEMYEKNVGDVDFTDKLAKLGDGNFNKFKGSPKDIKKAKDLVKFTTGDSQVKVLGEITETLKNQNEPLSKKLETIGNNDKLKISPTATAKLFAKESKQNSKKISDPKDVDSFSKFINKGNRINTYKGMGKAAGIAGKAMLAKGIVSSLIRNDEKGLLLLGGMLVGDTFFTNVGQNIAAKATTKALKTSSKFFKGVSRAAGPIGAALTSGYEVYLLYNAVERYKNPNITKYEQRDALADIVDNSVSLGITVTVVALSIAFPPFTPLFALVGVFLSIFVTLATMLYQAQNHVDSITNVIALSNEEKDTEFGRRMIGLDSSQYILNILASKSANEQQVKNIADYLKDHSEFMGYVFPSFYVKKECKIEKNCDNYSYIKFIFMSNNAVCYFGSLIKHFPYVWCCEDELKCQTNLIQVENSKVSFRQKEEFFLERAAPALSDSRQNLCLPSKKYSDNEVTVSNKSTSYKCDGAIGILHPGRVNGSLIIALGDGDDEAEGLLDTSNYFIVGNGKKLYKGGNRDDEFIISGTNLGELDGGQVGTQNTVIFENTSFPYIDLSIDLVNNKKFNNDDSYISMTVNNIQRVIGRQGKKETIMVNCDTNFVSGSGGSFNYPDEILIGENINCGNYSLEIKLDSFTRVVHKSNFEINGIFNYRSFDPISNYSVKLMSGQASHTFFLYHEISRLSNVGFLEMDDFYHLSLGNGKISIQKNISTKNTKINVMSLVNGKIETQFILNLDEGTVQVYHLLNYSNQKIIREGAEGVTNIFNVVGNYNGLILNGKSGDDVFILNVTRTNEALYIYGGSGINTLLIANEFLPDKEIEVDMSGVKQLNENFIINNIQKIIGRESKVDRIVCNISTLYVEGRGGGDKITIPQEKDSISMYNIQLKIDNDTDVYNYATNQGSFNYQVESPDFQLRIFNPNSKAKHNVLFNFGLWNLRHLSFSKESNKLEFIWSSLNYNSTKILMSNLLANETFFSNPSFQFVEKKEELGLEIISQIKVDKEGIPIVEILIDKLENVVNTLIANFTFRGLLENSNIIKVSEQVNCFNEISGGNLYDIFWINYDFNLNLSNISNCYNNLNGLEGSNTLVLERQTEVDEIYVDLLNGMILTWDQEFLFEIENIQKFYGNRETSEVVVLNICTTTFVDGLGGWDRIIVPQISCVSDIPKDIALVIREKTVITFLPSSESNNTGVNFVYALQSKRSFSLIGGINGINHNHTIILPFSTFDLEYIFFSDDYKDLKILYGFQNDSLVYSHGVFELEDIFAEPFYTQPKLMTNEEDVEIKVSTEGDIYFALSETFSVAFLDNILKVYAPLANKLNVTMIINEKDVGDKVIQIGNKWGQNALSNMPNVVSILVGNGGPTLYTILETDSDVWVYHYEIGLEEEFDDLDSFTPPNFTSVLDLTNVIYLIREELGYKYAPEIGRRGDNLIFEFHSLDFEIILVNGIFIYSELGVLLSAQMMYINFNQSLNHYTLIPVPISIEQGSVYIYSPMDLEDGSKIITNSSGSNTSISDLSRRESDLVLSNLQRIGQNEADERPFIFTILNFYNKVENEADEFSRMNNMTNIILSFSDKEELQLDLEYSHLSVENVLEFDQIVETFEEIYLKKYPEIIVKYKKSREPIEKIGMCILVLGVVFAFLAIFIIIAVVYLLKCRKNEKVEANFNNDNELLPMEINFMITKRGKYVVNRKPKGKEEVTINENESYKFIVKENTY